MYENSNKKIVTIEKLLKVLYNFEGKKALQNVAVFLTNNCSFEDFQSGTQMKEFVLLR